MNAETDQLPHTLTFYLSPRERRDVLRALRRRHRDRATALCLALRIERDAGEAKIGGGQ
jgi:hypothetical protein